MESSGKRSKIILAGGTGMLGGYVVKTLTEKGYELCILTRSRSLAGNKGYLLWDGKSSGTWNNELENALAVINLSGARLHGHMAGRRYREVYDSRILSTMAIGNAITNCKNAPSLWINASSVFAYGNSGDTINTENSPAKRGFLANLCHNWEKECTSFELLVTRKVILRIGIAAGEGGLYKLIKAMAGLGIKGIKGYDPYISWIYPIDLARAIVFIVESDISGIVNGCSPNPVRLSEMLANMNGRAKGLLVPATMVKVGLKLSGMEPSLLLEGRRVLPAQLIKWGFSFKFDHISGVAPKH